MTRGGAPLVILLLAFLVASGPVVSPGNARAADADEPPLTMEELEVLGRREKPDALYVPVPAGIRHAAPVRFDLFLEDMTRPILPGEIHGPIQP